MQNSPILSSGQFSIHLLGLLNGVFFGKINHTMQLGIKLFNSVQKKLGQCQAGDFPGTNQRGQFGDGHKGQISLPAWFGDTLRDFPFYLLSGRRELKTVGQGIELNGRGSGIG